MTPLKQLNHIYYILLIRYVFMRIDSVDAAIGRADIP